MAVHGYQSDSVDPDDIDTGTNRGYGLALEGYFTCSEVEWLCRLDEIGGYNTQQVVGRAIQHKAAAQVISDILQTNKINRYTLKPKEELWGRRQYLNGEYANAVNFIAQNLPAEAMDCLECKSSQRHRRTSLLV